MKKLIIANWKMNPSSAKEAVSLAKETEKGISKSNKAEVVICPPFVYLHPLSSIINHRSSIISLGAQNVFWESAGWRNGGAYTGEVSPAILKNSGVEYVIIGHSERRKWLGETDEMVNKKVLAALKTGLKVILCVGEPERKVSSIKYQVSGKKNELKESKNYVRKQLEKDLKGIVNCKLKIDNLAIAYEPVWAISTNKNARADKPEDALEMIKFIKDFLLVSYHLSRVAVLYGGSVTSKNAKSFLQYKEIDGALVGGASLKAEELKKIVKSTD